MQPFFQLKSSKAALEPITSQEFFYVVDEIYRQLDLTDKPESIWNFDATSVMLPEPPKKTARKRKFEEASE